MISERWACNAGEEVGGTLAFASAIDPSTKGLSGTSALSSGEVMTIGLDACGFGAVAIRKGIKLKRRRVRRRRATSEVHHVAAATL
jgi:hypothetical protein